LAICGSLLAGCEVRDEDPRTGPTAAWLETMARRLTESPVGSRTVAAESSLECVDGFAAGSRRARESGLPMLLVFRASWCRWSGDLVEAVLADEQLAAAAGQVVCITIDADREAAVCRSYSVHTFPTVIALGVDRRERFRATGAAARRGLATALEAAVAAPDPRIAELPAASPR